MQKGHAKAIVKRKYVHVCKIKVEMRVCRIGRGHRNFNA